MLGLSSGLAPDARLWLEVGCGGTGTIVRPPGVLQRPRIEPYNYLGPLSTFKNTIYPPAVVCEIPSGTIHHSGAVVTGDGFLIRDSADRVYHPLAGARVLHATEPPQVCDGKLAVAISRGANNFAHVLADLLPKVWQIKEAGIRPDGWIVPSDPPLWLDELLSEIGVPRRARVELRPGHSISATHLVVASPSGFAPLPSLWIRDALQGLLPSSTRGHRRLFIRRHRAKTRRWLEEAEALVLFERLGFEPITMEELTLQEQLQISSEATAIIGVHGAGLAHVLLAPPKGLLFEVAPEGVNHPDYWGMAAIADWAYGRSSPLVGVPSDPDSAIDDDFSACPEQVFLALTSTLQSYTL